MHRVRAALYLDFDNVFTGLLKQDPDVAMQFAEDPGVWAARLATSLTVDGPRRWLVLRCYMNPAGWVPHPDPAASMPRLQFYRFRSSFTRAGFEVVDCPRLTHTKNAADIRIVVDALEALGEGVYDEFVIGSGDSDMTPLLQRLRRADRRTTVVSPLDAAEAFTAVADRLIGSEQLLELVQGEPVDADEDEPLGDGPSGPAMADAASDGGADQAYERFRSIVTDRYTDAGEPLNLASLAHEVRRLLGGAVDTTSWFGHGGFVKALEGLQLPEARFSQHYLWHDGRHPAPPAATASATPGGVAVPEPVDQLCRLLGLPRLETSTWAAIYQVLADYAETHRFNLTEATRWSRDELVARDVEVRRNTIALVTRGAAYGGCPLYRQPPPSAAEIGAAFLDNVLGRADAADLGLSEADVAVVREWLAVASPPQPGDITPERPPASRENAGI
ncbi:NYN domain-containing protein [Mangrovihabitans endophyticus]|uniref:NYN domain-containing protein n=1 Tax=Mangrovihabitans endophyticus TaxID=1751298 RepID=A0A8J3C1R3_9ACTN|nr:NYN domain-containing protein [Mangrovihabitans endophyticus]GGL04845.1 NYN domain-containing protein [Mangrovihabitans endophyticus]